MKETYGIDSTMLGAYFVKSISENNDHTIIHYQGREDLSYVVSAQQTGKYGKHRLRGQFSSRKVQGYLSQFDEFTGLEACTWGRKSCTNPQIPNTSS